MNTAGNRTETTAAVVDVVVVSDGGPAVTEAGSSSAGSNAANNNAALLVVAACVGEKVVGTTVDSSSSGSGSRRTTTTTTTTTTTQNKRKHHYLEAIAARFGNGHPVREESRQKLCLWFYSVADHFQLSREIACAAMSYLDRAAEVQLRHTTDRNGEDVKRHYQRLATASLYIAIKLHGFKVELNAIKRDLIATLLNISRGFFSSEDILTSEADIIQICGSEHLHAPQTIRTAASAVTEACCSSSSSCPQRFNQDDNVESSETDKVAQLVFTNVAEYVADVSLCDSFLALTCDTASVAYALNFLAIQSLPSSSHDEQQTAARERLLDALNNATATRPSAQTTVEEAYERLRELCPTLSSMAEELWPQAAAAVASDDRTRGRVLGETSSSESGSSTLVVRSGKRRYRAGDRSAKRARKIYPTE